MRPFATYHRGRSPVVAVAVHHGHAVRKELLPLFALDEAERLREEDPHTGEWTSIAPNRAIAHRSRFEVDLNRPRAAAVYRQPCDAWGLCVWNEPPAEETVSRSLAEYDRFYERIESMLHGLVQRFGQVLVLDLHTYNHRRAGPDGACADPEGNPEINVGTGSLDRERWSPLVDSFLDDLSRARVGGRTLDVRENVRFRGGEFPTRVHRTFPGTVCALAVEVKKFFMDEWTGRVDRRMFCEIREALRSTLPGALHELERGRRDHLRSA